MTEIEGKRDKVRDEGGGGRGGGGRQRNEKRPSSYAYNGQEALGPEHPHNIIAGITQWM